MTDEKFDYLPNCISEDVILRVDDSGMEWRARQTMCQRTEDCIHPDCTYETEFDISGLTQEQLHGPR